MIKVMAIGINVQYLLDKFISYYYISKIFEMIIIITSACIKKKNSRYSVDSLPPNFSSRWKDPTFSHDKLELI